jgi:asparagine synthetase B (glutamine-hydrolysing)
MCGIFGIITKENSNYNETFLKKTLASLAKLSEARGKDSSGICIRNNEKNEFRVLKSNQPITGLMKSKEYKLISKSYSSKNQFFSFGHSRLVTNGSQLESSNNQPVIKNDLIATHNGIIVNVDEINAKYNFDKKFDIDTEVFLSLMDFFHTKNNLNTIDSLKKSFNEIFGTISTSLFFEKYNQFVLATNNGSLYYVTNNKDILIYGSERYIIERVLEKNSSIAKDLKTYHLKSNTGVYVNLNDFKLLNFNINDENIHNINETKVNYTTIIESIELIGDKSTVLEIEDIKNKVDYHEKKKILEYNIDKVSKLQRCKKCILPITFPFIKFDEKGVCNYCNNYVPKNQPKSIEELKKMVEPYRSKDGSLDCLVPFSGGRDSTYVLHFVKNVLELNPLAYTYDWGMVTDLARRNIARVCGKLGVENIIVAADIKMKRKNIKLNIEAWLKKQDLGMIPLFMAGDKQFFKYANIVKKQANIDLNIWGINFLENTDFKVGFCGVKPDWNKEMIYSMSAKRKFNLFSHVGKNIILNPSYINSSLFDTFDSFLSRYLNPRKDYYHFFDFYRWDEKEIEQILLEDYDWEVSKDLKSTWRIGDGTASFYNYIYYTVAGFSEFDTFRSNQIREGMITREEALEFVNDENKPRYDSLRWYLEIVGVDYDKTINIINKIPKLYS